MMRFHRPAKYQGYASVTHVTVDGIHVLRLRMGQRRELSVTPGLHRIEVRNWGFGAPGVFEVRLAEGEVAEFVCGLRREGRLLKFVNDLNRQGGGDLSPTGRDHPRLGAVIRETSRSEEDLGSEVRIIENPSRSTTVTRVIRVSRDWTRSWTIGQDWTGKAHLGAKGKVGVAEVEASVEAEIKRSYSLTETLREEYVDDITLLIPAESRVKLILNWKRLWQHGEVTLRDSSPPIRVPFSVAVGVTFDQVTE